MVWPLLMGLGVLAANHFGGKYLEDRRDEELASKYRGLLGVAPGPMGPPDETGAMGGTTGGMGLLADPKDIQRQLEFASGVTGLRGQQPAGLNLLNAAFGRAQQEAERQQQAQQYAQQFARQGEQFERTFGAGREDAAAAERRWGAQFGQSQAEAERQARQWRQQFGLSQRADARAEAMLGMERDKANAPPEAPAMPKLPAGWMYQAGPGGAAVAAPIPGTTDWSNGVAKAESLQSADTRVGQMLDMLSGVEKTTEAGNKVRTEGMGTELWGQNAAKYSVLRGQIISDLGKQREMGVLDQKEYDRLVDQLPDPTSMGSLLTRNSTMQAGYQELRKQMRGKRKEHLRANPWLVPTVPKGFEPVDE